MIDDRQDQGCGEAQRSKESGLANEIEHSASVLAPHSSRETYSQQMQDWRLDRSLFFVVCTALGTLMLLLCASLYVQYSNYRAALAHVLKNSTPIDHASVISYSRALDFAVVKTSALFLAFALVFVGALYVLRIAETGYKLGAGTNAGKLSLQTSSPGLVMVTLGVILIAFVLNAKSAIEYSRVPSESPQAVALDILSSSEKELQSIEPDERLEKPPLSRDPP